MSMATFRIWRGVKGQGQFRDYTSEVAAGMVVLDVVHQIQAEQAGDLAVRWNCKAGRCSSCSAEINGMPKLMCMTRLNSLALDKPVTVKPMKASPHIKDLVTDVSWNYDLKQRIPKFKPRPPDAPDGTWRIAQEDVERVQEFRNCIECYLCQDVCHVLREHHMQEQFVGPRFLVHAAALEMHPLDVGDRLQERGHNSASGCATSPSVVPRCVPKASPSPTTPSFRSRNALSIASSTRFRNCSEFSLIGKHRRSLCISS